MKAEAIYSSSRLALLTKRYHTWVTTREQNVGEHTSQLMMIYRDLFGSPRSQVWEYMLLHDVGEHGVGDIPFPVKAENPVLKQEMDRIECASLGRMGIVLPEITAEEKRNVKICDLLEMWAFGYEEFTKGNKFAFPIVERTWAHINSILRGDPLLNKVRAYQRRYEGWNEI